MTGKNSIRVLQLNTNRSNTVVHTVLNSSLKDFDLLLITEPWWGAIGNEKQGPVAHQTWTPIIPVATVAKETQPRTMAYVKKSASFTVTLQSDITTDVDLQVLEIHQLPLPPTLVINLYHDNKTPRSEGGGAATRIQQLNLPRNIPTILAGDWNTHHPLWNGDLAPGNARAEELVDWLTGKGFSLENEPGRPTYLSHDGKSMSTIDLTFSNAEAAAQDIIHDWAVDPNRASGSDHHAVTWTINYGRTQIKNVTDTRYNFKKVDPEEWVNAFKKEIAETQRSIDLQALTDPTNTFQPGDLDKLTDALTNAMKEATKKTMPLWKPSEHARPWWDLSLDQAQKKIAQQRQEQQQNLERYGTRNRALNARIKKSKNWFKRIYKARKQAWSTETLEEAKQEDIWSFRSWSKGERTYPSVAIDRGPDQTPAIQHGEKCDALRNELFQPPPRLEDERNPDLTSRQEFDFEHNPVTETEVKEALSGQSIKKAPGVSQMNFQVLRWSWTCAADIITGLIQHCIKSGYHPKGWRKSIAVALRKPGKPDYSKPRAYRLIQLLECIGKVLEKVVANRLSFLVSKYNLVPSNQFGGRPHSSTTDAALTFVNDVEAAWNHKLVTTALTFDITGFFDFVNHKRLLTVLRKKGIPLELIQWTASFLSDRETAVCLDGIRGEMKPIVNGIPQGSPVSPILSILYCAELNEIFQNQADSYQKSTFPRQEQATSVNLLMYIDDGKLYVSSKSLEENVKILRRAYDTTANWLKSVGLSPDYVKRELMHYTRKRQYVSPSITLPGKDGEDVILKPELTVKWLGIYFDKRLNFDHHIKAMAARAEKAVNGLSMLANTVKGLHQTHLRTLYQSCVMPILTYASAVWWTGKEKHVKPLERVQRRALRLICAVFRTTPITALEIESSIPPIRIALDLIQDRSAICINKLSKFSPIMQRLPKEWRDEQHPNPAPPLPTHKKPTKRRRKPTDETRLTKLAKKSDPKAEKIEPDTIPPWRITKKDFGGRLIITTATPKAEKEEEAKKHEEKISEWKDDWRHLLIYTDGSMKNNEDENINQKRTGAGLVIYQGDTEMATFRFGMGTQAEVYDAEMAALEWGIREAYGYATLINRATKHLHFFADNNAAVSSIFESRSKPGQQHSTVFRDLALKFLNMNAANTIEIAWVPGHEGIKGNERADELAKEATQLQGPWGATIANTSRRAREKATQTWKEQWQKGPLTGRYTAANRIPPSLKPTLQFRTMEREVFGRVTQCRVGHGFYGEYYSHFVPGENVHCPICNTFQTREHILCECDRYKDYRHILQEISKEVIPTDIIGTVKGIQALGEFIKKSGAFTKTGDPRKKIELPCEEEEPEIDEEEEEEVQTEEE